MHRFFLLLLLVCSRSLIGQGWYHIYPVASNHHEWDTQILLHPLGGYVVLGYVDTVPNKIIRRVDSTGAVVWTKPLCAFANTSNAPASLINMPNGFLAITSVAETHISPSSNLNLTFIRLDLNGDTVWTRTLSDSTITRRISSVRFSSNGDLLICGAEHKYFISAPDSLFIIRADTLGNILWNKKVFTTGACYFTDPYPRDVVETSDGGYFIANEDNGYLCLKTDSAGTVQWVKYPQALGGYFRIGKTKSEKLFVVADDTMHTPTGPMYFQLFIVFENSGNVLFKTPTIQPSYIYPSVENDSNGNIYMTGLDINHHIFLAKFDSSGNVTWIKNHVIPGTQYQEVRDLIIDPKKEFTIVGNLEPIQSVQAPQEGFLLHLDSLGELSTAPTSSLEIEAEKTESECAFFPNPAGTQTTINSKDSIEQLKIFNLEGSCVFMDTYINASIYTLHTENFAPGLYFYQMQLRSGEILQGKLILKR